MVNLHGHIVYLAGPISKVDWTQAKVNFVDLEAKVRKFKPQQIYNPLDFMAPPVKLDEMQRWSWYMKQAVRALSLCDAIVLMDNYHISKGARLEKYLAEELGITVIHERELHETIPE